MCTLVFLKDVLRGHKKLLLNLDTVGIPDIPRVREINSTVIWNDIKQDATIKKYFPDIYIATNRVPQREYMFKVILKRFLHSDFVLNFNNFLKTFSQIR
jgi:hypothetical protein